MAQLQDAPDLAGADVRPAANPRGPRLIDLYDNPQERIEETLGESAIVTRGWVAHAMFAELAKFQATLKQDPPVPMGTTDPYVPPVKAKP